MLKALSSTKVNCAGYKLLSTGSGLSAGIVSDVSLDGNDLVVKYVGGRVDNLTLPTSSTTFEEVNFLNASGSALVVTVLAK